MFSKLKLHQKFPTTDELKLSNRLYKVQLNQGNEIWMLNYSGNATIKHHSETIRSTSHTPSFGCCCESCNRYESLGLYE